MHLDTGKLIEFYASPLGRVVRQHVRQELVALWPAVTAERVVGLGHATPYLRPFTAEAERVLAVMPAAQGVHHWPREGLNLTLLAHEDALPLPDAGVDRVLMIHLLEGATDPVAVMRETWRILVPGGRLLAVVPYRSGPWARADRTPFGLGRPFSRGQLAELMTSSMFEVTRSQRFLFTPPSGRRFVLGQTRAWERMGRKLWPRFAGMVAMEATKVVTRGIAVRTQSQRIKLFAPALRPAGAASAAREATPAVPSGDPCTHREEPALASAKDGSAASAERASAGRSWSAIRSI